MKSKNLLTLCLFCLASIAGYAQGLIRESKAQLNPNQNSQPTVTCGSYDQMEYQNRQAPGYLNLSNDFIQQVKKASQSQKLHKTSHDLAEIQVVFHMVYDHEDKNVPDSVFADQIRILNECFRRQNADTTNMRADFKDIVGDAHIEFKLATKDPDGMPTSGIVRTKSNVKNFGGILPFGQGQTAEILKWVNDSLFINFFRLTETSKGGSDAWDPSKYLNIWVGDLRIFEPQFNNFEELVYFGLATPPAAHPNWPDSVLQNLTDFNQGVLLHYNVIGSNNPIQFQGQYAFYNGLVTSGKMGVHEVGHYLGLRHIWGDGNCDHDDFIDDTPGATVATNYNCNKGANSCTDDINGKDLPNMLENYMDYSSGDCQNSFTKGQIELMRAVLENYRKPLVSVKPMTGLSSFRMYPNPTHGVFYLELPAHVKSYHYRILDLQGKTVDQGTRLSNANLLQIEGANGIYFLEVQYEGYAPQVMRVLKQ